MNTEHRKLISINEIKRKEKKIKILTEQLDLRDLYIKDAYKEIELNKCEFNYKNPKIISSEEIDVEDTNSNKENDVDMSDSENDSDDNKTNSIIMQKNKKSKSKHLFCFYKKPTNNLYNNIVKIKRKEKKRNMKKRIKDNKYMKNDEFILLLCLMRKKKRTNV